MDKKVTVLMPNGRRQNVNVTPNTTLLHILEEACKKHGLNSDEYGLLHHNKQVGLTQIFRFSGLPNNCVLEMIQAEQKRIETAVDICIQLEDGSRQQAQFKPSANLWDVVKELNSEAAQNYASPVAIYMRQEIIGKENLARTSLKSLGIIEGRAMIRFVNKEPEELRVQANVYVAPVVKDVPKVETSRPKNSNLPKEPAAGGFAVTKGLVQSLKIPTDKETAEKKDEENEKSSANENKPKYDWGSGQGYSIRSETDILGSDEDAKEDKEMEIEPEVHVIGERNAIIYSLDSINKQIENLPDSFYDLTVQDLKLVLRDLKKIATGDEDAPLLTQKLREMEENQIMLNKIGQYKNCVIRIQFPNRFVLQGMFKPIDKVSDVVDFVRKFLQNPDAPFHLFTIPQKKTLPLDTTLLEMDFVPTALIHFAYDDDTIAANATTYVRAELLEQLTSAEGALFVANKYRARNRKNIQTHNEPETEYASTSDIRPGPSTGAIPKRPRN